MIKYIDHISIIVSSEKSIIFYEKLGFSVSDILDRGYDKIVMMNGNQIVLKIFVDPSHPKRVGRPEAFGLRYIAFKVDSLESVLSEFDCEPLRGECGNRYTFIKDPDGLLIEFYE